MKNQGVNARSAITQYRVRFHIEIKHEDEREEGMTKAHALKREFGYSSLDAIVRTTTTYWDQGFIAVGIVDDCVLCGSKGA